MGVGGYFKNKKFTVIGLGRSGLACANLLYELGADVRVSDIQDSALTRKNALTLKSKNIKIELGRHSEDFIKKRDLIIISPGVSDEAKPIIWAKRFGVPVIGEIELAWILCPATVIAITGSNGKTTVTTLIGKIIEASGRKAFVCGNIGTPFIGELKKMKAGDYVSLEVSSFQLEKIYSFKPKISVMLNFTYNHLDRYKNMEEYLQAKKRIFMNQEEEDYLVLNEDDAVISKLAKEAQAKIVYFGQNKGFNSNQSAVMAVASILGIDKKTCLKVFDDFKGLEHRMEEVAKINNIEFINDSKSTTADSTIWALKNTTRPVILIAGGKDKGVDYGSVMGLARKRVRKLILIGEARQKIKKALKGVPAQEANTLEEAVRLAFEAAKSGDCVLLSPMCSSFDMFSDFEERGRIFKKCVLDLSEKLKAC